ncbi:MAG: OmpA-like protein [Ignavibacteria bacterium]|nr:OmpA-like protein [Ignavibacteria bacterium]
MKKLLLVLFFTTLCSPSFSQELKKPEEIADIGLFGGYSANQHIASFSKIEGTPFCCPKFESGTGSGFTLGTLIDIHLWNILLFGIRADYTIHDGILKDTEKIFLSDTKSGQSVSGEMTHTIDSKISTFGGQLIFGINLFADLKLFLGGRAGYIITKTFTTKSEITKPSNFPLRYDTLISGDIPNTAFALFSLLGGLSYDIPLNPKKTMSLTPYLNIQFGLNNISTNLTWKTNSFIAGLALKYHIIEGDFF